MRRFGVWFALLLLIPYLQFVGGGWFGIYESSIRLTSLATIGGVFAAWAFVAIRNPAWRPDTSLAWAILAVISSLAASTILSRQPRISLEYLAFAILLAALYLLLVRLLRDPFLSGRLANLTVILMIVTAGGYLIAVASRWIQWWGFVGSLTFPPLRPAFESFLYGNPSSVMVVVVLLFFAAVAAIGVGARRRVFLVLALTAMTGAVTITSGSRAGWLAFAVTVISLLVVLVASPLMRPNLVRIRSVASSVTGRIATLGGAMLAVGVLVVFGPGILTRALESGQSVRGTFVFTAVRQFQEAPVAGTGPGTWVAQRIQYTTAPEADYYIPHAHNMYAQTLSELGIIGVVAGLVLLVGLLRLIAGAIRGDDPVRRRWGYAALAAGIYFGAHSSLDLFMNMPAILFPLAIPFAWLDATRPRSVPATARPRSIGLAIGGVAIAAALAVLLVMEIPAFRNQQAVDLAGEGDWAAAGALARAAVDADPEMPAFYYTEGLTLDRAGDHAAAADAFRWVAQRDDLPEAWLNLAAEEATLGDSAAALDGLRRALRLGYQRPAVAMPAGELARELGDIDLAIEAFASAVVANPSLAGDPFWTADADRAALFADVVEVATGRALPSRAWEIPLATGDAEAATALAADAQDPALAADVVMAWHGNVAARERIYARCAASPLNLNTLQWCARLAHRAGDDPLAVRYRFWSEYVQGGAAEAGSDLRVATKAGLDRWISGDPAQFWGYYTYRRPIPWDLLVPSLVHLVVE